MKDVVEHLDRGKVLQVGTGFDDRDADPLRIEIYPDDPVDNCRNGISPFRMDRSIRDRFLPVRGIVGRGILPLATATSSTLFGDLDFGQSFSRRESS